MSDDAIHDAIDYVLYNDFGSIYGNIDEGEVFSILSDMAQCPLNESELSFRTTKKQLKEARKNKLMKESKRFTKKDFKK
jgi:hypothetical protein